MEGKEEEDKHKQQGQGVVRVCIVEGRSGRCLRDQVWRWSGPTRSEGVSKLVATFYQLARELNPEAQSQVVHQVLLEHPSSLRDRASTSDTLHTTAVATRYIGGSYKKVLHCLQNKIVTLRRNPHGITQTFRPFGWPASGTITSSWLYSTKRPKT